MHERTSPLLTVALAVTIAAACGDDGDGALDDATSSATTATAGTDDTDSATQTSGPADTGTTAADGPGTSDSTTGGCDGVLEGDCGACLAQRCCAELSACAEVSGCLACVGGDAASCGRGEAQVAADALRTCGSPTCDEACGTDLPAPHCSVDMQTPSDGSCVVLGGTFECNPITQEPCDVANGAACDVNVTLDGFSCYPADNVHALCETCSVADGFCQPGLGCPGSQTGLGNPGQCSKFCCDDADCGPDGTCYRDFFTTLGLPVGYCIPAR